MPETHDLGRAFIHTIYLIEGAPLVHLFPTQELDEPFRVSKNSIVVRLWPSRRGVVLGWWKSSGLTEAEALRSAVRAHDIAILDDTGHILDEFEDWDL